MLEIEKVSIPQNTNKVVDIIQLRDTEQGILNYMLLSHSNFLKIKNILSENDFTFLIHKRIYKYLIILEEMFLADTFYATSDISTFVEIFADILHKKQNLKAIAILDILSQSPSMYIDSDLEVININSMEKEIAIYNNEIERSVTIETKDGLTRADYINDRLISIGTTNITQLPIEIHVNFGDTFNSFENLNLENRDIEVLILVYENMDDIASLNLKKDLHKLRWFNDICKWADKYELEEEIFPRDRYKLQGLAKLDISNRGINELPKEIEELSNLKILIINDNNIKELPDKLYKLKNLVLFSLMKNEISYISEEIINLQELLMFAACHNDISILPNNFFKLKNLTSFCLHGNKLTSLPSEIGSLTSLESLTISNNKIKILPLSLSKLENLESLDIENTQISEIPIEFLNKRSLNKLSINDSLLPFIVKNMQYLNVDTINLSSSDFKESSQIVQELKFKIDKESWMKNRNKKNNGCILLSKDEAKWLNFG